MKTRAADEAQNARFKNGFHERARLMTYQHVRISLDFYYVRTRERCSAAEKPKPPELRLLAGIFPHKDQCYIPADWRTH